jgi:hypothetical protein
MHPIIDELGIVYESITEAVKKTGISRACITNNVWGRSKTTCGKTFKSLIL